MKNPANRTVQFLGSIRLATSLLALLILAAVVGGVVPQSPTTPNASDIYATYGPFLQRLITRLAFDDVFHSWWFLLLVSLLTANLSLCTARRIRRSACALSEQIVYREISDSAESIAAPNLTAERFLTVTRAVLRRTGIRRIDQLCGSEGLSPQLVGRRFRFGILGADLVHLGILVILLGAVLGVFRQEGTFTVNEWQKGLRLLAGGERSSADCVPLPYNIQVDDFGIETYEDSGFVKTYWADLSFWHGDNQVVTGRAAVNYPLSVRGVSFHPWRFGQDPTAAQIRLHVLDTKRNVVVSEVTLRIGESAIIPSSEWALTALNLLSSADAGRFGDGASSGSVPAEYSAVLLQITPPGGIGTYQEIALPFLPETTPPAPYSFQLVQTVIPTYLEILFVRSPGYRVVWSGFILVMAGLAIAFYFAPISIRVAFDDEQILLRAESRRASSRLARIAERIRSYLATEPAELNSVEQRSD